MPPPPLEPPVLADVIAARERIAPHLRPTELRSYSALSGLVGTEVWVKHENLLPTGAFKVRGGVNLVAQLSDAEREAGLIAASTGNHGQSIAYAAQLHGVRAVICVPEGANPIKVAAIEALGAEVVFHGRDFAVGAKVPGFHFGGRRLGQGKDVFGIEAEVFIARDNMRLEQFERGRQALGGVESRVHGRLKAGDLGKFIVHRPRVPDGEG